MAVGVLPSSAFPAIFPRVYGERCCPRSRLPLIGPRGLRCGGISVELVRKVGGGKSRRVEKFAFYALSVTCDCRGIADKGASEILSTYCSRLCRISGLVRYELVLA